jgi:hypothetical protein
MLNVASLFLGLHLGQQLGEAHVESSGCLVEVDDALVGLAPLDAHHEVLRAKATPSRMRRPSVLHHKAR